jgi:hypothetical protein
MNRLVIQSTLVLALSPFLAAQQSQQAASLSAIAKHAPAAEQAANTPQPSPVNDHNLIIKNARTMYVDSCTDFLTVSTMDRALLSQKSWAKLGLDIVDGGFQRKADLELRIDRLIFTHIHTYVLTDRKTGIVLASGRVTAFDGVVASGPMAEQIVKILSAARLPAQAASAD